MKHLSILAVTLMACCGSLLAADTSASITEQENHKWEIKHKFVAYDKATEVLFYVDENNPENNWAFKLKATVKDMQLIGNSQLLLNSKYGYAIYDMKAKEIKVTTIDKIQKEKGEVSSVIMDPDGTKYLAAAKKKQIEFSLTVIDKNDKIISETTLKGLPPSMAVRRIRKTSKNTFIFSRNNAFVEMDIKGKLIWHKKYKTYGYAAKVVKLANGNILFTTKSNCRVGEIKPDGTLVKTLGGGRGAHEELGVCANHYGSFDLLENGNVVVINGAVAHAKKYTKGRALLEYDAKGKVVWTWTDFKRPSLTTVIIMDDKDPEKFYHEINGVLKCPDEKNDKSAHKKSGEKSIPVGFRSDGRGCYPEATPVTEWGQDKNVVWKTKLPNWSNACPVVWGDKIFICAEPTTLICVNAADGKIIWQKTNDYVDLVDAAEAAKIREDEKKSQEIRKELSSANREFGQAKRKLRKQPDDADAKQQTEKATKKVAELEKKLEPFKKHAQPRTHKANGYTSATPVTDGKHVWVVFGTGVVACYDMDGKRIWGRIIEKPTHQWGSCISPRLAGNVLLAQYVHLFGLDAATGKELWKAKTQSRWGTPVIAKIDGVDYAIVNQGSMLRVSDGKVMPAKFSGPGYGSLVLVDGVLYTIYKGKAFARKLPEKGDGKPEELWTAKLTESSKERHYASPVIHDGLMYALSAKAKLHVLDIKTGEIVFEEKLGFRGGCCYPSPTLAGKNIVLSHDSGKSIVIEPGRTFKQVAGNELEPFRSCPVFIGGKMYIRALEHLWCIGK